MDGFVRNLITEWRRLELPVDGRTLIVAVSGGADSVSLLLAIDDLKRRKKLDHRIVTAHFNHKLRGEDSDHDEQFVKELCTELKIELIAANGSIATSGNLEQNARIARYKFLVESGDKVGASYILTGHTINDQAETFLLNLLRGSGLSGLSGMRSVRDINLPHDPEGEDMLPFPSSSQLVRPLLSWATRRDTENYCHEREVEFRYDTMNEDLAYKRVRIRKILLPMLEEFNPKIVPTLANTADLVRIETDTNRRNVPILPDEPEIAMLADLPQGTLYNALRKWIADRRGDLLTIQMSHIEAIEALIKSKKSGRLAELPGGDTIIKTRGRLTYNKLKVEK